MDERTGESRAKAQFRPLGEQNALQCVGCIERHISPLCLCYYEPVLVALGLEDLRVEPVT